MLCRVLTDDEHTRRAVQPSAVEDRSPLDAELAGRVNIRLREILGQSTEWLLDATKIEWM